MDLHLVYSTFIFKLYHLLKVLLQHLSQSPFYTHPYTGGHLLIRSGLARYKILFSIHADCGSNQRPSSDWTTLYLLSHSHPSEQLIRTFVKCLPFTDVESLNCRGLDCTFISNGNTVTLHMPDKVHSKLLSLKYKPDLSSSYQNLCLCCSFGVEVVTFTAA